MKLFPNVRSGGFYVIENLNWQPIPYEKELPIVTKSAAIPIGFS